MRRLTLLATILVSVLTLAVAPALAQSRPQCDNPSHPGSCFIDLANGEFCIGTVDFDGDQVVACPPGSKDDFLKIRPDGAMQFHVVESQAYIYFCPGALMPDCWFTGIGGLEGYGHAALNWNMFPEGGCSAMLSIFGTLHNADATRFFALSAFEVDRPGQQHSECIPVKLDISATPVSQ